MYEEDSVTSQYPIQTNVEIQQSSHVSINLHNFTSVIYLYHCYDKLGVGFHTSQNDTGNIRISANKDQFYLTY
jgi:uncharacterized protein YcfL